MHSRSGAERVAQVRVAEAAGFDAVLLMDHFYQLPGIGSPDEPMLEAYTALGALATATERIQLSTPVTGNTYRNPSLLAKKVSTLEVVSGERKTFGLAARFADHLNINCNPADLPRKLEALDQRCAEVGRDRSTLETTSLVFVVVDENGDNARRMHRDFLHKVGIHPEKMSEEEFRTATARHFVGIPDDVAADLQRRILDTGVGGVTVILIPNVHVPGVVTMAGDLLRKLLR